MSEKCPVNAATPNLNPESRNGKKNILIVYAHPDNKKSLNAAFLKAEKYVFANAGDTVVISDLYDMKFNPALSGDDFLSPPAILKLWFERVFAASFAFSFKDGKLFNRGPMKDRRIVVSFTVGGNSTCYTPIGMLGDIENGTLHFCGFQVVKPQIEYGTFNLKEGEGDELLMAWKNRLRNIWSETPRAYYTLESCEYSKGFQLSDAIINGEVENPDKVPSTIGQHMNKPINSEL
ncbi:DgyrCDS11029 [Dimorphilus gyrociliatus]|uniref:DgyrCDS11029 n=1 Tax=Dimorphilus gyrociliatus TaxID=2664684 RepID=A0A7I8W274_9ANNE|nr:DgyrCDS11029 [Dimorphilus gyrociliatus]